MDQDGEHLLTQVRQDFVDIRKAWPTTDFLWSWRKSHTTEKTSKARGNARADKLADMGMRMAQARPRKPTTPRRVPAPPTHISPFSPAANQTGRAPSGKSHTGTLHCPPPRLASRGGCDWRHPSQPHTEPASEPRRDWRRSQPRSGSRKKLVAHTPIS